MAKRLLFIFTLHMAFFLSPKELSSPPRGNELGQQEDKGEIQDSACLSLASSTEGQTPTGKGPGQVDGPQATFSPPASAYVTILEGGGCSETHNYYRQRTGPGTHLAQV